METQIFVLSAFQSFKHDKKNNNMKIANITLLYIYTNNSHKVGSVISMREDFLERQCVIPSNAYHYDRDKSQLTNDNC